MKHNFGLPLVADLASLLVEDRLSDQLGLLVEDKQAFDAVKHATAALAHQEQEVGIVAAHAHLDKAIRRCKRLAQTWAQLGVVVCQHCEQISFMESCISILSWLIQAAQRAIDETWILDEGLCIQVSLELLESSILALRAARPNCAHLFEICLLRSISVGGAVGPLRSLLLLVNIACDIHNTDPSVVVLFAALEHIVLLRLDLLEAFNPLGSALDDGVCNGFLHQVDLALPDQFHMRVGQRNLQLRLVVLSEAAQVLGLVAAWGGGRLLHRWKDQEGVAFGAEVEVLAEGADDQELSIRLHLQQVVLLFPHERDALEFAKGVSLSNALRLRLLHSLLGQHEVEDQLLAPEDNALDHIEREHAQAVQNVDALFEQWNISFAVSLLGFVHNLAKLTDLREAGLTGNDGSDSALNR